MRKITKRMKHPNQKPAPTGRKPKIILLVILISSLLINSCDRMMGLSVPKISGTAYFVDCEKGSDGQPGTTPSKAWKTIEKINNELFKPGDGVFFKRGTVCLGSLHPQGSGQESAPINIGAYGKGPQPIIEGGQNETVIQLKDQEYWHIQDLEVKGGTIYGIRITGSKKVGTLNHFRLTNLIVHNVYGGEVKSKVSGLVVFESGGENQVFNDVIVDGVTAYDTNQWGGIIIAGAPWPIDPRYMSTNVVFRNSTVHNVYGDGIVLWGVQNGLIETSVAYDTGQQPAPQTIGTPSSIWTWSCYDCTVQDNESYLAKSPEVDGGCYDVDWNTRNNLYQYNYGHDSDGYCISFFGAENYTTSNAIFRYNVCANNARKPSLAVSQGEVFFSTWTNGKLDGVQIYNNTFYYNPPRSAPFLLNHAAFTGSRPNFFKNNILYSTATWLVESDKTLNLDNNLYWYSGNQNPLWFYDNQPITSFPEYQKSSGQDIHSLYTDPQLNNPTYHETGKPKEAFTLQAGSPAVDAGTDVGEMGKQDFFGNPIPNGKEYDIGAYEWSPGKTTFLSPGVLQIGDYLPNVRLNAIRGGIYRLKDLFGQVTLLSFLDTLAPISRKQIVFLRSMYQQYSARGVKVVIITADPHLNLDDLLNFTYDWELDSIPVLVGNSPGLHGKIFANRNTPTTYLISADGKTLQRWDGLALPFQLASAIQKE